MKRIICLLLALGLVLCGCAAGDAEQAQFTFTDDLDREVRLESEPKRVA